MKIMFMDQKYFNLLLYVMTGLAVIVFFSLYFVTAGYGQFRTKRWGWSINNKLAWVLMEAPAFIVMMLIWGGSGFSTAAPQIVLTGLFLLHYFLRSFVFPLLMRGKSKMPVNIMLMGAVFNIINGIIQGGGLYWFPQAEYQEGWNYLSHGYAIVGLIIFFAGLAINWHSDRVVRHLRKPGDTRHYLPTKGFFRWVTSANYFGELTEWTGFALIAMSPAAWVFVIWTASNLIPRSASIHKKYVEEFGKKAVGKRKRIIPGIY